ncbi:hypothetical protein JOD45_001338 [Scopulibacillus daqui]|uniref:Uncharacterized protein n=1 Tax=Scopulibacillus daqui TaxID=1469162 RepID=A0ABS2Q0R2_9BACL|nr:hypothetical protein [Scopulibacillus daqui]
MKQNVEGRYTKYVWIVIVIAALIYGVGYVWIRMR